MQTYAPIALFTYNRADHTRQAVESLLRNAEAKDTDLFIFSDGPKNEKAAEGVKANREFIRTITGFKSITIIEREKNWGLANSLIAGITDVINKYGRVIVVEDDLTLSRYFLKFMNEALEKYKDDERISSISGFCPVTETALPDTYFLQFFHCWGWATWRRGWELANWDVKYLLRKMRFKTRKFDIDGTVGSYGNLLCQKFGLVDSWYIRLYASFFLSKKLTLFPCRSLVHNTGLDGTGTHCGVQKEGASAVAYVEQAIELKDIPVEESQDAYDAFRKAYGKDARHVNWARKSYNRFKSFIRRLLYVDCW